MKATTAPTRTTKDLTATATEARAARESTSTHAFALEAYTHEQKAEITLLKEHVGGNAIELAGLEHDAKAPEHRITELLGERDGIRTELAELQHTISDATA